MAIHWPDRHVWGARAYATRAAIRGVIDQYPWAAGMVAVPLTLIGFAGVVVYPFLFIPLLVLLGVALVAVEYYADQQQAIAHEAVEHQPRPTSPTRKWNLSRRGHYRIADLSNLPQLYDEALARMNAAQATVRADEARARAAAAQALAVEAEKQAEAAQARVAQLRHEAKTETHQNLDGN
jgi:hypothetical protein